MYLYIPVELCEYAIRNNFYRPLQLYIHLKTICCGKIKARQLDFKEVAATIGLSTPKGVRYNLGKLVALNWIGYDNRTKYYYIRGFDQVRALHGLKSRTAAEFDSGQIADFKAFVAAAKIGYLVNKQKRKKRAIELHRGSSVQVARHSSDFFPVACEALAKILDISISTAYKLKKLAAAAKFIEIHKTFKETGLNACEVEILNDGLPELTSRKIIKDGKILLQDTDMVRHFIRFKRRKKLEEKGKKLETYIKGVIGGNDV